MDGWNEENRKKEKNRKNKRWKRRNKDPVISKYPL